MLCLVGCQCECQCAGPNLEPTTGGSCAIDGCAGSGHGCHSSQIEFTIIGLQDDVPVTTGAEIVGIDAGDLKCSRAYSAICIGAQYIILCQSIVAPHSTLGNDHSVIRLIGCQGECDLAGIAGSCLEPTACRSAINGSTRCTQGCCRRQRKCALIGIQNDIPVIATEVVGTDAGDIDTGLDTTVSLREEHKVFLQGETVQHHTGRKDHLVVCLVGCQRECQCAGTGLEPTTNSSAIEGCAGSGHRCCGTQGEIGIIGSQNDIPVTAAEVIGTDAGNGKLIRCRRCFYCRHDGENQAKGQKERKYSFNLFHCSYPPLLIVR